MALMAQDKKVKRGKLTFILLEAVGRAVIARDVEPLRCATSSRKAEGQARPQGVIAR